MVSVTIDTEDGRETIEGFTLLERVEGVGGVMSVKVWHGEPRSGGYNYDIYRGADVVEVEP